MQFVRSPAVTWAFLSFFALCALPGSAYAHGFGDYKVFTFVSILLVGLVGVHTLGTMIVLGKGRFGSKRLLRISLALSTTSILIWLFVFKVVMDSHAADVELFVVLAVLFALISLFAVLPVKQYERLTYGSRDTSRRLPT